MTLFFSFLLDRSYGYSLEIFHLVCRRSWKSCEMFFSFVFWIYVVENAINLSEKLNHYSWIKIHFLIWSSKHNFFLKFKTIIAEIMTDKLDLFIPSGYLSIIDQFIVVFSSKKLFFKRQEKNKIIFSWQALTGSKKIEIFFSSLYAEHQSIHHSAYLSSSFLSRTALSKQKTIGNRIQLGEQSVPPLFFLSKDNLTVKKGVARRWWNLLEWIVVKIMSFVLK